MNQPEERTESKADVVAEALAFAKKADELRSAAIEQLLAQRDQIERNLKTLGYVPPIALQNNGVKPSIPILPSSTPAAQGSSKRFKNMTLAEIAKILLTEHEILHGKQIEELAKAGGFKGGTNNFQNYMPVAFKRAGGFQNVGGNRWKLNNAIQPKKQSRKQ